MIKGTKTIDNIEISSLSKESHKKVIRICDSCKDEKIVEIRNINRNRMRSNTDEDKCYKCAGKVCGEKRIKNNVCPRCKMNFRHLKCPYCVFCQAEVAKEYGKTIQGRYNNARNSANQRNLVFDLSILHFQDLTSQTCTYCDRYSVGKDYVGIDQIIPSAGYNLANCLPCCDMCNYMKRHNSIDTFLENCRIVADNQRICK